MMWNWGYGGGWGWGGTLMMFLWWMFVIIALVTLVQWFTRRSSCYGGDKALEILKERYARGEIDKKEFEEKKEDLI
ncbi:electron transporter RnfE [Candidatus Jorgensenbacteria bacterium CG10_big_fil_rev_8_21_14_0_10_54_38]|uniref:Electron transporter RnfE n=2 Tax=Candidatus Joergenseniibacteriota TaxID=1752739 RepID=A0A2M6WGC0_9BACT|nr:MAG: electron transporter RnfE [Candidatus Jorgensenbacteria bacterium CG23_combo_of_CG06-09_8_20_14_all_54_14]PIT91764.1 MAG: electron transporter RnfE [Candidatus Jorgensenbacteria bacterium CG10_big_fil_rev_8_21_14_0_10_54_38]